MEKEYLLEKIGPEFFSAIFKKANGEIRTILGKLHVKDQKFFAGGQLLGNRNHLLECIDVNVLKNLISLKVKGEELVKKGESNARAA